MNRAYVVWIVSALAFGSLAGCRDETSDASDSGPEDGGGLDAGDGGGMDAGDAGPMGDDTFATATTLTLGPDTTNAAIEVAGDVDFYKFTGTENQWLELNAQSLSQTTPKLDLVITLYDASMTKLATGRNDDSESAHVITHLAATGVYYVKVEDESTFAGSTPLGDSTYTYSLAVGIVPGSSSSHLIENQVGTSAGNAQALALASNSPESEHGFVFGTFASATNVDSFSFTISGNYAATPFYVVLFAPGVDGNGSTASPAKVEITSTNGATVVVSKATGLSNASVAALLPGNYLVRVTAPATLGANPFYAIAVGTMLDGTLWEESNSTNGSVVTAENAPQDGAFFGFLPAADVDNYKIDAIDGQNLIVQCISALDGSGVQGLRVGIYATSNPASELANASETPPDFLQLEYPVTADGTYAVQITKTGQNAGVTGDWYQCFIAVQ